MKKTTIKYLAWLILGLGLAGCGIQSYPIHSGTYVVKGNTTLPSNASLEIDTRTTTVTMRHYLTDDPLIVVRATILDEDKWVVTCQTNFTADRLETWALVSEKLPKKLYLSAGCVGENEVLLQEDIDPNQNRLFIIFKKR